MSQPRQKLTSVDSIFFHLETHDTPMHVAGLQVFSLPAGAGRDFMQALVTQLRSPRELAAPWNLKLRRTRLGRAWVTDNDVDLDYHVRHLSLPQPGGERELGALVSRLHSHRLNPRRPLWECHVIEGLENNRFALFTKIHHALADGVTAMRLLTKPLSDAAQADTLPPWAARPCKSDPRDASAARAGKPAAPGRLGTLREQAQALPELAKALRRVAHAARGGDEAFTLPFMAPRSVLNGAITGQRRLATQQFDLARLKAVARAADATLNDVVLALSSAALRRYLKEANTLPDKPLVAAIPVSLRQPGDTSTANAVSIMFAGMGTDIAEPRVRLQAIREATLRSKEHLLAIPKQAQPLYNGLLMTPMVLQVVSGLATRTRPYFNVTVSNVPGPAQALYLRGAKLEAMYPVSIPTHGQALNITCTSYNGTLNFGFTSCRDALPHMQRLAVYTGEALDELEAALGIAAPADATLLRKQLRA